MGNQAVPFHPTQSPAVLSASMIGTWQWNIPKDQVSCDETNARLLGLTADEATHGVPLLRIFQAIHPDDRERFRATTAPARAQGGSVSMIVRTAPEPSLVRRVILRGHYAPDTGFGRGVLIDVTDLADSISGDGSEFPNTKLEETINTCFALRERLDPHNSPMIRLLLDMLLLELGRELAAVINRKRH